MRRALTLAMLLWPGVLAAAGPAPSKDSAAPGMGPGDDGAAYVVSRPGSDVAFDAGVMAQMRIAILKKRGEYEDPAAEPEKPKGGH